MMFYMMFYMMFAAAIRDVLGSIYDVVSIET